MNLEQVHGALADFLTENGIDAVASWPDGRRTRRPGPVVLVSLERMQCSPAGMQDYLGQQQDPENEQWEELYGRRVQLTFTLDILADGRTSAQACRRTAAELVRLFQTERPGALSVQEMELSEAEYEEKEDLLRLRCTLRCAGLICTAGQEAGTFLEFTLRGDMEI